MKIWVDDVRSAPEGYVWCKSTNRAKKEIILSEYNLERCASDLRDFWKIELIDLDHDAGQYEQYGGDYIRILDWLEETGRDYPIRIHSMNPVGRENMRRIIKRNGWKEIY